MIEGREINVTVNSYITPEKWVIGQRLIPSDWNEASFRLPTANGGPIQSIAVNVKITGRTFQRRLDRYYVRVQIEFVGDGEPSTFSPGWLLVE